MLGLSSGLGGDAGGTESPGGLAVLWERPPDARVEVARSPVGCTSAERLGNKVQGGPLALRTGLTLPAQLCVPGEPGHCPPEPPGPLLLGRPPSQSSPSIASAPCSPFWRPLLGSWGFHPCPAGFPAPGAAGGSSASGPWGSQVMPSLGASSRPAQATLRGACPGTPHWAPSLPCPLVLWEHPINESRAQRPSLQEQLLAS